MTAYTLHQEEKLKSKKSIEYLFRSGRSFTAPPFRLVYREVDPMKYPTKMAVSVPKRMIKKATDRNLVKRRIREAYRLNKDDFYSNITAKNKSIELLVIYQSQEILDYKTIYRVLKTTLIMLSDRV